MIYIKSRLRENVLGFPTKSRKLHYSYWQDFLAFMRNTFPDIDKLEQVMLLHCEAYVSYLISNSRFSSKSDYPLGNKTICEIASSIKGVFRRFKRDAGLLENPWNDVIFPVIDDSLRREIFTVDEYSVQITLRRE